MTRRKLEEFVALHLKGDNSEAEVSPLHIEQAIADVCRQCIPAKLVKSCDKEKRNFFRSLPDNKYLYIPDLPDGQDYEIPIEEELAYAVIYFICSYLSNKDKPGFWGKAINICNIYDTNQIYIEDESEDGLMCSPYQEEDDATVVVDEPTTDEPDEPTGTTNMVASQSTFSIDVGAIKMATLSGATGIPTYSVDISNTFTVDFSASGTDYTIYIEAIGVTDPDTATITITDDLGSITIQAYSNESQGGIL